LTATPYGKGKVVPHCEGA